MADKWTEEDDENSIPPSSPAAAAVPRRRFDDEEDNDSDILESWDAADDSENEHEKSKISTLQKAKSNAEAAANKKSKTERIAEIKAERIRKIAEDKSEFSEEDEATKRIRLLEKQYDEDMVHVDALYNDTSISDKRKVITAANAVQVESDGFFHQIDLTTLSLFNPKSKLDFEKLRDTLLPLISNNSAKAYYIIFLQEFIKQLAKELPSDQIKKIASSLTALSNEKMKEEKLAEKGGKKSKAAKTKATLVATKNITAIPDVNAYDDDYGDDDFM